MFEFLTFEIHFFHTTSDEEMTKTKVIDLDDIDNFVVENYFI
jgi:hypothetical protein